MGLPQVRRGKGRFLESRLMYLEACGNTVSTTSQEWLMKISVDRNVVEITPESEQETKDLDLLWKVVIDCYGNNKKLVPMGHFIPGSNTLARFNIEGIQGGVTAYSEDKKAAKDDTYYCKTCNKYMQVKAGTAVPLCCGREMETVD
jgi:hypothetical protein